MRLTSSDTVGFKCLGIFNVWTSQEYWYAGSPGTLGRVLNKICRLHSEINK